VNAASLVGRRIGPYEIVGWLGAGGMGDVYRARDSRLGRDVALKVIDPALAADAGRVRRFEQEARAAGQLNHPNVLAVYDSGIYDGTPYIVSELLEGETLRSRLSSGPMPPRKAIDVARQVAEGLAAAHQKGIFHRDVKPENLFITTDGRVKILDFGIAKLTASSEDDGGRTGLPTDTAVGTVMGTVRYMSPEQIRGESVDARSDIFSLGLVLYEMLTGRPAFARDTAPETMTAILKEDAPDLQGAGPAPLVRIIARCMERSPDARFQSARDLAFALDVLSDTRPAAAAPRVTTPRRRRAALAAGVVVLTVLTAAAWIIRDRTSRPFENPLIGSTFTQFTNFEGSELDAAISPDGRFVAFTADRDGPFHVWLKQVGTGSGTDLTP
jgi:serine/threonine protein kinase